MVIIIKQIYFEDYEDLACDIADSLDDIRNIDKYNDVAIIAKYAEARQVIKELLCIGYDIASIHLDSDEYGEYSDEYVITICNIDGDDKIWVEPFKRDNGYYTEEAPIIYVMDNCSSKVIPYCKGKVVFEVTVGEEEYDCDECCGCCECDEETTSTASYSVNGKEVTKAEFNKKYEEFENKYMDNIRDMLLNYCEFMDEVNEWQKLFRW